MCPQFLSLKSISLASSAQQEKCLTLTYPFEQSIRILQDTPSQQKLKKIWHLEHSNSFALAF